MNKLLNLKIWNIANNIHNENNKQYLKQFRYLPDSKLIDLGCHTGELALQVAQKIGTKNVYGVELDREKAEQSKQKGINVEVFDLNQPWPYPNNSFDVISANQILEHLWNTDNFFKETYRVLKPNGYAVISTPNLCSFHNLSFMLIGQQPPSVQVIDTVMGNFMRGEKVTSMHYKAFNIPVLKDLAKHYGFTVEKIVATGYYFWPITIQKLIAKAFGRYAMYITIRIKKTDCSR